MFRFFVISLFRVSHGEALNCFAWEMGIIVGVNSQPLRNQR